MASLVLTDSSKLTSDSQHLGAATYDGQNLGIYLSIDCQKSAVNCHSAPKKPWGYCTYNLNRPDRLSRQYICSQTQLEAADLNLQSNKWSIRGQAYRNIGQSASGARLPTQPLQQVLIETFHLFDSPPNNPYKMEY
uniref:Uncharacterized protein n=1 Tax=Timema poppense TaxID=170557 RepID=A0A7R9CK68_TIMPO|nr:unnamed protein product [Timema poppensis]